jgi:rhodanese-related sulfurtransferase
VAQPRWLKPNAGWQNDFLFAAYPVLAVLNLMGALRRIAERNIAEVEQVIRSYFNQRDSLEPVSREELLQKSRAGEVTVLDVRPPDEFALGHLPDAVNIPLRELEARLAEFDPAQEIVAYCRGPYCVLSYEAVAVSCSWFQGASFGRRPSGVARLRPAGCHW